MSSFRWRLDVAWRGTEYGGWQIQPNRNSIQAEFEKVLSRIFNVDRIVVAAAGRTDAGVHAEHQVLGFSAPKAMKALHLMRGLNALLPDDISVSSVEQVPEDFHPRHWGYSKWYRYRWLVSDCPCPFRGPYVWYVPKGLEIEAMSKAAAHFEGSHDMSSFRASGCSARSTVRTIESCRIHKVSDDEIVMDVKGNGFLRHQIRIMAGTVYDIGRLVIPPDTILKLLKDKDRTLSGRTAPAKGLTLMRSEIRHPGEGI
jgi:tRNA pseudouridine38-40 synthase